MSSEALKSIQIESIQSSAPITCELNLLTFVFNGNIRSPGINTYKIEPYRRIDIPTDNEFTKITFGKRNNMLVSLTFYETVVKKSFKNRAPLEEHIKVISIEATNKPSEESSLTLQACDKIVSAKVDINDIWPINIQF